jgi:hypothetical protein
MESPSWSLLKLQTKATVEVAFTTVVACMVSREFIGESKAEGSVESKAEGSVESKVVALLH